MTKISEKSIIHIGFDIGLLFKGLDAIAEIISGIALMFLSPDRMSRLIAFVSSGELSEDPKDYLMNYLVTFGHTFSAGAQQFAVFYLLSHGILKLLVILLLWRKKLWAYPLSVFVFIFFIIFQLIHFMSSHSVMLILLTILDVVMIVLTILEYRRIKSEAPVK